MRKICGRLTIFSNSGIVKYVYDKKLDRTASRKKEANLIRSDFNCDIGQVNFDGKLLAELGGFGKVRVTRITVVEL